MKDSTTAGRLTKNQWKLLGVLDHWGGHGTIEVCTQFGEYELDGSEATQLRAWNLTQLVVKNLMRSLARRGLAVLDAPEPYTGYDITELGREVLRQARAESGRADALLPEGRWVRVRAGLYRKRHGKEVFEVERFTADDTGEPAFWLCRCDGVAFDRAGLLEVAQGYCQPAVADPGIPF